MAKNYRSQKRNNAADQATAVTKNTTSDSVADRLDKAKNVDCSDDASDMVLERFSSCNLEAVTKSQSANQPFYRGGIPRAKVKNK